MFWEDRQKYLSFEVKTFLETGVLLAHQFYFTANTRPENRFCEVTWFGHYVLRGIKSEEINQISCDIKADKQILKIISCPLQKMQSEDKCFLQNMNVVAALWLHHSSQKCTFRIFTFCTEKLFCRNLLANIMFQNVIFHVYTCE